MYPYGTIYTSLQNFLPESFKGVWRRLDSDLTLWNAWCANKDEFGKVFAPTLPKPWITQTPLSAYIDGSAGTSTTGICIGEGKGIDASTSGRLSARQYVRDNTLWSAGITYNTNDISVGNAFLPRPRRFNCSMWVRCDVLTSDAYDDAGRPSALSSEPIELVKIIDNRETGAYHYNVFCFVNEITGKKYKIVGSISGNAMNKYEAARMTDAYN